MKWCGLFFEVGLVLPPYLTSRAFAPSPRTPCSGTLFPPHVLLTNPAIFPAIIHWQFIEPITWYIKIYTQ